MRLPLFTHSHTHTYTHVCRVKTQTHSLCLIIFSVQTWIREPTSTTLRVTKQRRPICVLHLQSLGTTFPMSPVLVMPLRSPATSSTQIHPDLISSCPTLFFPPLDIQPCCHCSCSLNVCEGRSELVAGRCCRQPSVNAPVLPTRKQVTQRSHACEIQQARRDFLANWILHEAYFSEQLLASRRWCMQLCASLYDNSFNNQRLSLVSKSSRAWQRRHLCPTAVGKLLPPCSQGKMKHCLFSFFSPPSTQLLPT